MKEKLRENDETRGQGSLTLSEKAVIVVLGILIFLIFASIIAPNYFVFSLP